MAKKRLFSEPPKTSDDDTTKAPREAFNEFAGKLFSTPKAEIDKREERWKKKREAS